MKSLQHQVIEGIARRVDAWRGFGLGPAREANPADAPRYAPAADGEHEVSETTMALLQHWFRAEPHEVGTEPHTRAFKYWPHQRRLVETFIYLHEVARVRRTEEIYRLAGVEAMGAQRDPWAKLGGQLATGSGKTKMMSLIVAWAYLNAVCERENDLGLGSHSILIAPGLFVKDRLLQDFFPPDGRTSIFWADPVIPPALERYWHLRVYDPVTCPRQLDPSEGALVVTNYHQLLRSSDEAELEFESEEDRQTRILFEDPDPQKLESVRSPLIERFARSRGLVVLNDEAHHVWDEPGHQQFEDKARQRSAASEDEKEAMAWIRSIRKLNGNDSGPGRVGLQVDLSATLFQETGTTTQAKKKTKKGQPETRFKENELFRHTVVTYGLDEAIRDGIVKKPVLERVEVRNERTGEPMPLVNAAAPNAWKQYEMLLITGIERWMKVRDQLREEGDARKPILFVLCSDKKEAAEVANFLTYGDPTAEDLDGKPIKGYTEPNRGERLFVETGSDGLPRSTVVQIHIGQKEESNEAEWDKVRAIVNAIDHAEVEHEGEKISNPFNVVISVMMLKEGWDVRNVKVIVPLRPCGSRTLTEQTLGRGLRKMHPPEIEDDGSATTIEEALFVIEHPSFQEILDQIDDLIERKTSDEIDHRPDYVAVPPLDDPAARSAVDVRLVRLGEERSGAKDWRKDLDVGRLLPLSPRLPWLSEIDAAEVSTWLKAAMQKDEEEGQQFTLPVEPSYRDFDHVIENAYVKPLLKELRLGYEHSTAVKGVVREYLEKKTFALPAGVPIRFDEVREAADARIALGNLAEGKVVGSVRAALMQPVGDAIRAALRGSNVEVLERRAADIGGYQALKQGVLEELAKSPFQRLAGANPEECRLAALLDDSRDVVGWIFNHRQGVGYSIPYDWQGHTAHYFPDFIVRAKIGLVFHNFIIEVKGRLDDKDKAKATRGQRWCELLTEHDREPWHFQMLIENKELGRNDIDWLQTCSGHRMEDLLKRHEGLPLIPTQVRGVREGGLDYATEAERFVSAVPVFELAERAQWQPGQPELLPKAWARVPRRPLDSEYFVAQINTRAMEPGVYEGNWGLFRAFDREANPREMALDLRRVVVAKTPAPTGDRDEQMTCEFARWRVTRLNDAGDPSEITLRPDNKAAKPTSFAPGDAAYRVAAELLDLVG